MEEIGDRPDRDVRWRGWSRDPFFECCIGFILLVAGLILAFAARIEYGKEVKSGISLGTDVPATLAIPAVAAALAFGLRAWVLLRRVQQERLDALRADSLPERAKHATEVLREAATLVKELQDELTARTGLLEEIQRQVEEGRLKVDDLEKLSQVDDPTARAIRNVVDETFKRRLDELERTARQREWIIGTVVAVMVGMSAILISHFLIGF